MWRYTLTPRLDYKKHSRLWYCLDTVPRASVQTFLLFCFRSKSPLGCSSSACCNLKEYWRKKSEMALKKSLSVTLRVLATNLTSTEYNDRESAQGSVARRILRYLQERLQQLPSLIKMKNASKLSFPTLELSSWNLMTIFLYKIRIWLFSAWKQNNSYWFVSTTHTVIFTHCFCCSERKFVTRQVGKCLFNCYISASICCFLLLVAAVSTHYKVLGQGQNLKNTCSWNQKHYGSL